MCFIPTLFVFFATLFSVALISTLIVLNETRHFDTIFVVQIIFEFDEANLPAALQVIVTFECKWSKLNEIHGRRDLDYRKR